MASKKKESEDRVCPACKGSGLQPQTRRQARDEGRRGIAAPPKCPDCGGSGRAGAGPKKG